MGIYHLYKQRTMFIEIVNGISRNTTVFCLFSSAHAALLNYWGRLFKGGLALTQG